MRRRRPPPSPLESEAPAPEAMRATAALLAVAVLGAALVAGLAPPARAGERAREPVVERRPDTDPRGDGDGLAAVRGEFLEALDAARSGGAVEIDDALRGYALYPYLEAARLEKALADASGPGAADDGARAFLAAHGEEPVATDVKEAWLWSLARRQDWAAFLALYGANGSGEPEAADQALDCLALQAGIALGRGAKIAPRIVQVWLGGDARLPSECEPVFEWLADQGGLTDDLVERRVVLLLENGRASFARVIADRLPAERAAPLLDWADLLERPRRSIDALLAAPEPRFRPEALASGWGRLARDEPDAALARYAPLIAALGFDDAAASPLARALALGLAWDRRPEALDYFPRIAADELDDYALAWRTRAALWSGDWRLAARSIDAMSAGQRGQTAWIYWRARAAEQLHDRAEARRLYASIVPRDNYYAALAAARLGNAVVPHAEPLSADETEIARLAATPPFVRARELFFAGLPWHAAAEWRYGSRGLDASAREQGVHLAARWGWYDMAIATAAQQDVFNDYRLLYPEPYAAAVGAAARLTKIGRPLIYGLMRQESLYRSDAASAAGAVGLVQLVPDTARRVARRWGQPEPRRADLFVPEVNVKLGAARLRGLIDEFGEQVPVALAGYNAGANAARRWLPDHPLDADVWIENIPYNETRDFVQRVLWHSLVFAWLDTGRPRSVEGWLATIAPDQGDRRQAER